MNLPQTALMLISAFSTILVILKSKLQVVFHFNYTFCHKWLSIKSALWVTNIYTGTYKHYTVNMHALITKASSYDYDHAIILNRGQR